MLVVCWVWLQHHLPGGSPLGLSGDFTSPVYCVMTVPWSEHVRPFHVQMKLFFQAVDF